MRPRNSGNIGVLFVKEWPYSKPIGGWQEARPRQMLRFIDLAQRGDALCKSASQAAKMSCTHLLMAEGKSVFIEEYARFP